jgi:AGCS family alanine or glycine:cation symporter
LAGGKRLNLYRTLYIAAVAVGPYLTAEVVWGLADIFNGLMALPNLLALLLLSGVVRDETKYTLKRR